MGHNNYQYCRPRYQYHLLITVQLVRKMTATQLRGPFKVSDIVSAVDGKFSGPSLGRNRRESIQQARRGVNLFTYTGKVIA